MSMMRWMTREPATTIDVASSSSDLTDPAGEELLHHVGVHDPEKCRHEDRESRQDPAGHPSLRGERPDQPTHLGPFADRARRRCRGSRPSCRRRSAAALRAARPARCRGSPSGPPSFRIASSGRTPSRSSCTTRASSERAGSWALSTTTPRAPLKLCPARRAEASTCRLAGELVREVVANGLQLPPNHHARNERSRQPEERKSGDVEQQAEEREQRACRRAPSPRPASA